MGCFLISFCLGNTGIPDGNLETAERLWYTGGYDFTIMSGHLGRKCICAEMGKHMKSVHGG